MRFTTLLRSVASLISAVVFFTGCGGLDGHAGHDLTQHFWTNVHGDYAGGKNGYVLTLDPKTHSASWYKPLIVGNSPAGSVCYLGVKAQIDSVTSNLPGLFGDYNAETLIAKVEHAEWSLIYPHGQASSRDEDECDRIYHSNSYIKVDPLYVPVLAYGPDTLQLGQPEVCIFSSEYAQSESSQDFSVKAPDIYRHSVRPW